MKKSMIIGCLGLAVLLPAFRKKFAELEEKQKETQDLLNSATVKLNDA